MMKAKAEAMSKTKQLHWDKLARNKIKGTIWGTMPTDSAVDISLVMKARRPPSALWLGQYGYSRMGTHSG